MLRSRFFGSLSILTLSLLSSSPALACPDFLSKLKSPALQKLGTHLCDLHDRYLQVRLNFENLGVDAREIRAAKAPRLIQHADYFGERGAYVDFNPNFVYTPAPQTWKQWSQAEKLVRKLADQNYLDALIGKRKAPRALSEEWIHEIHRETVENLPLNDRNYRKHSFIGTQLETGQAVLTSGSDTISDTWGRPLVTWHFTVCKEHLTEAQKTAATVVNAEGKATLQPALLPPADPQHPILKVANVDGKIRAHRCGYYEYRPADTIPKSMADWVNAFNPKIRNWYVGPSDSDPIATAALAQRGLVGIHPFADGNGRTSRFVGDYLVTSLGLPPPVFMDMDLDLVLSDDAWVWEYARGMLYTLTLLENCLGEHRAKSVSAQCRVD